MDLDLQNLEPEPKEVTLNKVTFLVHPAKVKALLKIEQYFTDLKEMEGGDAVSRALGILEPLIPALKNDEIDCTAQQMMSLLNYVYQAGLEGETKKEAKKADELVKKEVKKK